MSGGARDDQGRGPLAAPVFVAAAAASVALAFTWPGIAPPAGLVAGILVAVTVGSSFPTLAGRGSKVLLQVAVALLGFRVDLPVMAQAALAGGGLALVTIVLTLVAGVLLGRAMVVAPRTSLLVAGGTAICGGSAIAAMAPAIRARHDEIAVSMGTVFLLNAIALLVFPPLGHALGLSPEQFGTWAGIAIHDVSSVVGAASAFDAAALDTATTVKLARALWIVPVVLAARWWWGREQRRIAPATVPLAPAGDDADEDAADAAAGRRTPLVPWFIVAFVAASLVRSLLPMEVPAVERTVAGLVLSARVALVLVLFLVGSRLSIVALRAVGLRPLVLGVLLWLGIAAASLAVITAG